MPVRVARFTEITLTRYAGDCSEADVAAAVAQGQTLARFPGVRFSIHDFTDCTAFRFSVGETRAIAARDEQAARRNDALRIAVVTTRPDVSAFVWTYIASDVSRYPVIVLPTRATAREWLDRHRPGVPPALAGLLDGDAAEAP